jgi:hypothetical protein
MCVTTFPQSLHRCKLQAPPTFWNTIRIYGIAFPFEPTAFIIIIINRNLDHQKNKKFDVIQTKFGFVFVLLIDFDYSNIKQFSKELFFLKASI